MKKYLIIPISIIFMLCAFTVRVYAAVLDQYNTIVIYQLSNDKYCVALSSGTITISDGYMTFQATTGNSFGNDQYNTVSEAINAINSNSSIRTGLSGASVGNDRTKIRVKGTVVNNSNNNNYFGSVDSYNESLLPTWYETMWDTFKDYFTNPIPFQWFTNLIDKVFGDDNNGGTISDNVQIGNPTIAPTPTPIPYTTVVIPKTDVTTGGTYYETNYYYVNPSGTPIVTGSPPTNAPTNNGSGNGGQTYSPVNGKPYSIPKLDWLSTVDIDGTGYDGIDSIGDGMSSVDEIGSEYADGMSAVQDASGTLPASWLLLIGIVAAIPLLAGIVSRFLGG